MPIPYPHYGAQGLSFILRFYHGRVGQNFHVHASVQLVAPPGVQVDLLGVTVTDMIECLQGVCSAYANAEKTVWKCYHPSYQWLFLQLSQCRVDDLALVRTDTDPFQSTF